MFFSKKSQGISLNTIVVAVLALVVLVVLLAVFSGKFKGVSEGQDQASEGVKSNVCNDEEYVCELKEGNSCPFDSKKGNFIDCPESSGCCVKK